ncbi:unnamed protein product [Eretmochelys imbricata]
MNSVKLPLLPSQNVVIQYPDGPSVFTRAYMIHNSSRNRSLGFTSQSEFHSRPPTQIEILAKICIHETSQKSMLKGEINQITGWLNIPASRQKMCHIWGLRRVKFKNLPSS